MTRATHDETALGKAEQASQVLFGGEVAGLTGAEVADIFADVPSGEVSGEKLKGDGMPMAELLVSTGTVASKGEARRAIEGGGVYLNNRRVSDPTFRATAADVIDGRFLVLRLGRKNYRLVRIM